MKIKQNKNSPAVRVASAALAVFVLFFSLCIPSFAYSSVDWSLYKVPYVPSGQPSSQAVYDAGLNVYSNSSNGASFTTRTQNVDIFSFAVPSANSGYSIYAVTKTSGPIVLRINYVSPDIYTSNYFNLSNLDGSWYFQSIPNIPYDSLHVPVFSSRQEAFSDLEEYLSNGYPDIPLTGEFTYSLPAGNVIFIDVTNLNVAVDLSQNTPISYWGLGATQYSGTVSSVPSSFDLPISGTSIISWTGSGKADSFGKYSSWVSHATVSGITSDHNHLYYVVANPLQNNSTAGSGYDVSSVANGDITIHVSNSNSVKVYQLETSFNAGVYDSNSAGDTFTGHNDGSGGLGFTNDTTGNPDSPSFGGMTTPESSASSIHDFLQNIATQISGFFSGAIGAVSTLVSAGRDFMQSVSGLYMWLPAPVYTVLTSAIILVITIGVIKVFV